MSSEEEEGEAETSHTMLKMENNLLEREGVLVAVAVMLVLMEEQRLQNS